MSGVRSANHQLDIGPRNSKARFTKDQLAAAGLGSGSAPEGDGNLIVEQGTGEPLLGLDDDLPAIPPGSPLDRMKNLSDEQLYAVADRINQAKYTMPPLPDDEAPPMIAPPPYDPMMNPVPTAPHPQAPADPTMAMMQQLMQQNAMLQQQLMQLTQQLASQPAHPQVSQDVERERRERMMREKNLSHDAAEKVLYGGHGLIG